MNGFRAVAPGELRINPFTAIGQEWMLVTAGAPDRFNTMTASWGALGVLWNNPTAICFVRPTRHTYGFINEAERFTLSFFDERHRATLEFCGAHSGRDTDKIAATGLKPFATPAGGIGFEQARLILTCRRVYSQDLDPARFHDPAPLTHYPHRDFHRMFFGEIVECRVAEKSAS